MRQLLEALNFLHGELGIMHRNIKVWLPNEFRICDLVVFFVYLEPITLWTLSLLDGEVSIMHRNIKVRPPNKFCICGQVVFCVYLGPIIL
jgi:hypothetical protein